MDPSSDTDALAKLYTLNDVFSPDAKPLVWTVVPSVVFNRAPGVLVPDRTIRADPQVLTLQINALVQTCGFSSLISGKWTVRTLILCHIIERSCDG